MNIERESKEKAHLIVIAISYIFVYMHIIERWLAKLVYSALVCHSKLSGFESRHPSKGRHMQRLANTLNIEHCVECNVLYVNISDHY